MRGPDGEQTERARSLRRSQTQAEARLRRRLRNRGLNGYKFSRQEPIGPYIADFVCREQKLVVELDGATHSTNEELAHDSRRTGFLAASGYFVQRFFNEEIYNNLDGVLETILVRLERRETL
jgi:very-short-patch-repair endonuclease